MSEVGTTAISPTHQGETRDRFHAENEGKNEAEAGDTTKPREHADRETEDHANRQKRHLLRLEDEGGRLT